MAFHAGWHPFPGEGLGVPGSCAMMAESETQTKASVRPYCTTGLESIAPQVLVWCSALEGHSGDELLHFVGQPLLPGVVVLVQGCRDLFGNTKSWDLGPKKKKIVTEAKPCFPFSRSVRKDPPPPKKAALSLLRNIYLLAFHFLSFESRRVNATFVKVQASAWDKRCVWFSHLSLACQEESQSGWRQHSGQRVEQQSREVRIVFFFYIRWYFLSPPAGETFVLIASFSFLFQLHLVNRTVERVHILAHTLCGILATNHCPIIDYSVFLIEYKYSVPGA